MTSVAIVAGLLMLLSAVHWLERTAKALERIAASTGRVHDELFAIRTGGVITRLPDAMREQRDEGARS